MSPGLRNCQLAFERYCMYHGFMVVQQMVIKMAYFYCCLLDNPYSYHWQQISAPEGSHGYMEGQDSRRVILSQVRENNINNNNDDDNDNDNNHDNIYAGGDRTLSGFQNSPSARN